jgi:exopolyphosphatase/guanosine-5'-triphosphate,3'-diphosphate pyrophosphatase
MIAIVDIGSNAVKYKIFDKKSMELIEYVREPLRLGTDVFITGSLSIEKINALLKLLNEYKKTFEIKNINECHFIATSAIRDASNNKLIVDALRKENINLQIISGEVEAELLSNFQCLNKKYCVVDIGGGSLEIFVDDGLSKSYKSFQLGAVRLLTDKYNNSAKEIDALKDWLKKFKDVEVVYGLGGNLRSLFEVSEIEKSIKTNEMKTIVENFKKFNKQELISKFNLPPDRIDIAPVAANLYEMIATELNANVIENSFWSISNGLFNKIINESNST